MAAQPTPESDIKEVGEKLILIKPHLFDLKWTNWAVEEQREKGRSRWRGRESSWREI